MPMAASSDRYSAFVTRIGQLVPRAGIGIGPDRTIREAAERMTEESIGSLVVLESGEPAGMVTKTDVVRRVIAAGLDPGEPVRRVMSPDVVTVSADACVFDGLMTMIRNGIGHLVVMDAGRFVGVLSEGDWLAFQRHHPLALLQRIDSAPSVESLADYRREAMAFLAALFESEGTARSLTELVTEINDRTARRVIDISLAETAEPPPAAFAWIAMGSEGRREQTLSTDQDNGLVFADVAGAETEPVGLNRLMERYEGSEARLGERVAEATASADAEMKQLGTVLDSLGQGVIVCDAAGNVVRYNRTARSLLEPSHEPRLGQPVYGMVEKSCATTPWRTSPPSLPPESGIRRWSSPRSVRPGTRSGAASHRWRTMMRRFTASS